MGELGKEFLATYRLLGILAVGLMGPGVVALPFAVGYLMLPDRSLLLLPLAALISAINVVSNVVYYPAFGHHLGPTVLRSLPLGILHRAAMHFCFMFLCNRWLLAVLTLTLAVLSISPDFHASRTDAILRLVAYSAIALSMGHLLIVRFAEVPIAFFFLHIATCVLSLYQSALALALLLSLLLISTSKLVSPPFIGRQRFEFFCLRQTAILSIIAVAVGCALIASARSSADVIVEIGAFWVTLTGAYKLGSLKEHYIYTKTKTKYLPFGAAASRRAFSIAGIAMLIITAAMTAMLASLHSSALALHLWGMAVLAVGSVFAILISRLRLAVMMPIIVTYYLWVYAS
jgi:hypothetical protein